ncbi:glycosyltransferase family A protein [Tessaracoccus oleiagri]|uniref:Glycosyltransferase involved in cell wall bisynthesis n=1 Tax=Tessaracoccus oleiagri TaxID=686624 RepID=A0A1G9IHH8_9ACTN|nr:glycosyltransferase family 2 protein [Tessaracoccus oleiagri]SDL24689.1 Glycosyltransferase involved in cell wall bisynthesis [Tessaracoccus oleiagri]
MKTLTLAVPSYNSAAYLHRCLDSMLPQDDDLEVIVVNDGSSDDTSAIAHRYAAQHPGAVRVVDKPNGGHGSAVNAGLDAATGRYFRVVDSDDWLDRGALTALLGVLRGQDRLDLVVSNFVYEKEGKAHCHAMRYRSTLPVGREFGWQEVGRFRPDQGMLMHALTYRTAVLRNSGLRLPEHTFYVDNLYAFLPLPYVSRLFYLDVDLYRYHIGRSDQSVNEAVMLKRLDQQLRVNRAMIHALPPAGATPSALHRYQVHYLGLVCAVSSIMLIRAGRPEHLQQKRELWRDLRAAHAPAHQRLRRSSIGRLVNLPGRPGRTISVLAYRLAQSVVGFN